MALHTKLIPIPGTPPNVHNDARRVFQTLEKGGIAIVPTEVGYGLIASSSEAITRAFHAKKRRPGHTQGIIGNYDIHKALHILPAERLDMTKALTHDLDMSIGIVAPYRPDHPLLHSLSAETLEKATKDGSMAIHVGGGSLLLEVVRLHHEAGKLVVGSSANVTGGGQKFRVEDIEEEILEAADIVVDYGLQRYHVYGRPSILFDFGAMRVMRMGSCYELFRERMRRIWGIELEEDPVYSSVKVQLHGQIRHPSMSLVWENVLVSMLRDDRAETPLDCFQAQLDPAQIMDLARGVP
ncbi:hypothetical protein BDV26DRAFT_300661 [Aspergillus bertholletiae]|uniref:Threonylcarbamoyl-AMP synthase n=1 Tax=Aspergillus bertholletiae TaxID=1226010 RepID=A0A5N7AVS3_9EURO|nr:hypothetical protein BDV26DRAFT_300661 [Aspergillus bertholletiae]